MTAGMKLTDVRVYYSSNEPVLDLPILEPEPGKITVIAGPTGSGKSTLGHAVAGLLPFMGARAVGTLHLGEHALPLDSVRKWRGICGKLVRWIPQEPARAFTATRPLLGQMLEGIEDDLKVTKQLVTLLEVAGLPDPPELSRSYPFEFSGGMLQRAALVSAFLPDPMIVVADEPTAHLDPPRSLDLARTVTRLVRQASVTLLWITHDLRMASAVADHVVFLSEGRIEAEGEPGLLLDPSRYEPLPIVYASARLAQPL